MKIIDRLIDAADLPDEPAPGQPLIEISGQSRVLIEHHGGVVRYTNESIGVRVKYGHVLISGKDLTLTKLTKDQLIISGNIDTIELLRGGC